ncbi:MAG: hypothetical protein WCL04_05310, partial [Verrucomicrobiota bacterium]
MDKNKIIGSALLVAAFACLFLLSPRPQPAVATPVPPAGQPVTADATRPAATGNPAAAPAASVPAAATP